MKILHISFPGVGIESTTCRGYNVPMRDDWPQIVIKFLHRNKKINKEKHILVCFPLLLVVAGKGL